MKNFIDEIRWRGLIHDEMPGIEDHLSDSIRVSYTGFDPTSNSLHIGSLVPIILLAHFQRSGHKPIALIGGATGMIGDPSGKSAERNLLDEETLVNNQTAIKQQLSQFLNFDSKEKNSAVILNNFDWMNKFSFLEFTRDIGKHISVNYMMSKDSVKNRISSESSSGMSFTEFTYQLIQGYDFLHLHKNYNCTIQMGGSDQWGNITTGTELIRRIDSGKGYALTCPLITKSDGAKFGKSETGNIWLDPNKTSVYKFYQYWLNTSDDDAEKYIKIFTFLSKKEINNIVILHKNEPHKRLIQKSLAKEITTIVHSAKSFSQVELASTILYSKSFKKDIESIDENTFFTRDWVGTYNRMLNRWIFRHHTCKALRTARLFKALSKPI
jgi:tyrosyl-tRNA synthetase